MLQLVLLIECLCFAPADPADAAAVAVVATVGGGCGFVLPTRMMISMKPDDGAVEIFCRKIKSQGGTKFFSNVLSGT